MTRREGRRGRDDPAERARGVALALLSAEVLLLAVTGIILFFVYRPSGSGAWDEVPVDPGLKALSSWVRLIHRFAAWFSLPTAWIAGVLLGLGSPALRRWVGPGLGASLALTVMAASLTGFLLPWDQLALWALTPDANLDGYEPLLRDQVRSVLIRGVEVPPATVLRWLLGHAVVGGPLLAFLLAVAWRRHGRSRRDQTAPVPPSPVIDLRVPETGPDRVGRLRRARRGGRRPGRGAGRRVGRRSRAEGG